MTDPGHGPSFYPPGPDHQLEALRLAVALYTGQDADEGTVLHTAAEFHDRLTRDRDIPPGVAREILTRLDIITTRMETIMTALQSLQDADAALKTEVTTAITDWAAQLAAANSANDPAIAQVASDMQAQVSALQAADTGSAASTGTGGDAGTTSTPTAAPTPGTSN
jgi:hypothetical protein